jgi:hypothetical protein
MMWQLSHSVRSILFVFFALVLCHSTVAWSADLDHLARNSDVILYGKALETKCQWAETSMNIMTHITFQVDRCVKGNFKPGENVTIEIFGGIINGMKQKVPNAPVFKCGDYALVFLTSGSKGRYRVVSEKQGMIPFANKNGKKLSLEGHTLAGTIKNVNLSLGK